MSLIKTQKGDKKLQIINKTINNKMSKIWKTKRLADYLIWLYQSLWLKITSKVKPTSLQLLINRKKQWKKILKILIYFAQRTHYLNIYIYICIYIYIYIYICVCMCVCVCVSGIAWNSTLHNNSTLPKYYTSHSSHLYFLKYNIFIYT